jgi:hypothetical protein
MRVATLSSKALLLGALTAAIPVSVYAQTAYTLTVQSGGRQTFTGFGASQVGGYTTIPASPRGQMADLVYRDLGVKVLRLWAGSGPAVSLATMKSTFYSTYVDNGLISDLTSRGVTTLLLAPARGEDAPTDSLSAYAAKIAQFIRDVKDERGINISVTGVANEPQDWSPQQITDTVKYLRTELNNRGLSSVQIIAPESASADSNCDAKLDAMHNDSTAWNALTGIASHSYNMAARNEEENRTFGKQYWQTEASDNGSEQAENENRAASLAARYLNDMNHRVTHWVHFIGFSYMDSDNATKLMVYDPANGQILIHLKYYYFKQLLSVFDVGAVFRRTQSSTEADMPYTYGQKPAINAAAAVNPDGSWAIGVVNDTGVCCNSGISQWYGATTYNVTVNVSELSGSGSQAFTLYRSRANQHFVNAGTVIMNNGSITVQVAPRELISLRSAATGGTPPAAPSSLTATAVSASQINLSWSDNSSDETGFNIESKIGSGGTYAPLTSVGANVTTYNNTGLNPSTTYYYRVNASNGAGTSVFSNEAYATTQSGGGGSGSLSGSVANAAGSYNLTTLGTSDWAHWNGTFIHKASGGTQISNVTQIGGGTYGTWTEAARNITWTDGTPTGSGTNDHAYIWCNGTANSGWTFTVPADTSSKTLHVIAGGPANASVKIAAHLSDGSAADYTDTQTSANLFTKEYTITYHAASASQTLTVTVVHTNSGSPSADLIAAWLTGGPALPAVSINATDASASETGPDTGTFTVTRSGSTSSALTVYYTVGGTATPDSDYAALSGSVTIPSGSSSAPIAVTPIDDTLAESSETVIVTISANADYAVGSPSSATVDIADNDSVGGSLSGSVANASSSYNLTTLGISDWAHWNGTFIHKAAGGTQISDVSQIGGGTYGTYSDASRNITWTDGTPTASGANDHAYIWCNGTANSGWTFTVPADASPRTLHVITGGPANASVKITAHLSDGSAADYMNTQTSTSLFTREYTITYNAASASQTLTIMVAHTNSGSPSADLIAAWLQ